MNRCFRCPLFSKFSTMRQITFKIWEAVNILGKVEIVAVGRRLYCSLLRYHFTSALLCSGAPPRVFGPGNNPVLNQSAHGFFLAPAVLKTPCFSLRMKPTLRRGWMCPWSCWLTALGSESQPVLDLPGCVREESALCWSQLDFVLPCSWKYPNWQSIHYRRGEIPLNAFITQLWALWLTLWQISYFCVSFYFILYMPIFPLLLWYIFRSILFPSLM